MVKLAKLSIRYLFGWVCVFLADMGVLNIRYSMRRKLIRFMFRGLLHNIIFLIWWRWWVCCNSQHHHAAQCSTATEIYTWGMCSDVGTRCLKYVKYLTLSFSRISYQRSLNFLNSSIKLVGRDFILALEFCLKICTVIKHTKH